MIGTSMGALAWKLRHRSAGDRELAPTLPAVDDIWGSAAMHVDKDRIDEAVLGLLWLTLHGGCRAWKGHDWDALARLHQKGMILDPVNRAKSVVLTDEGLAEAERVFIELFCRTGV